MKNRQVKKGTGRQSKCVQRGEKILHRWMKEQKAVDYVVKKKGKTGRQGGRQKTVKGKTDK